MRNKLILVLAVCVFGLLGCNQESSTTTATPAADQTTATTQDQATVVPSAGQDNAAPAPQKELN